MNCLEQVIIHDGYGHPIYFRTFSGNADLQKYALQSMEQLNELLNEAQKPNIKNSRCTRALIFDGGGNSVQALRAFSFIVLPLYYNARIQIKLVNVNLNIDLMFRSISMVKQC